MYYKAHVDEKEEFKVDWRRVEHRVKDKYSKLRLIYARGGQVDGHLAFSRERLDPEYLDQLCKTELIIQDKVFTFEKSADKNLKEFWRDHGDHYKFVTANRQRSQGRHFADP